MPTLIQKTAWADENLSAHPTRLRIDFVLATQREASQALVLEVGEHRLDDGDALVVRESTYDRVELAFHFDYFTHWFRA